MDVDVQATQEAWYELDLSDPTPEDVVEQCMAEFQVKDFIIEPRVNETLKKFLQAGGIWELATEQLISNYEGYGQLCNTLAEWMVMLGDDIEFLKELFETRLDEFIMKKFDPRKADLIFHQQSDEGKIQWLADLIANPSSRQMVLDLSEQFQDCLLLNFAIRLMADAGYLHEISSKVATSLEQQDIFTRVLCSSMEHLLQFNPDNDGYGKAILQLRDVVCRDEHTYLLTHALLQRIIMKEKSCADLLHKLCYEFRRLCHDRRQDSADLMVALHRTCGNYHPQLLDAMRSMLSKNQLNSNDMNVVQAWYSSSDAPSLELIQDPIFLDMILNILFHCKRSLHGNLANDCARILAIGSVGLSFEDEYGHCQLEIDWELVADCVQCIHKVRYHLTRIAAGTKFIWPDVNAVFNFLGEGGYDAIAAGVYHWVRSVVFGKDFYQLHQENLPIHFVFLDQIVTTKSSFHRRVFEVYRTLFESKSYDCDVPLQLSRQRVLIDRLLYLVSEGFLEPVMSFIQDLMEADKIDLSLIRYFVVECLEFAGPPYSEEFLTYFTPIARCDGIMETLSDRASSLLAEYNEYLEDVMQNSAAMDD